MTDFITGFVDLIRGIVAQIQDLIKRIREGNHNK